MAQPPDITETFVREVDENLRRDRIRDFFKDNGGYLVGLLFLFLAASGGFIWFQQHRENTAQAHVEQIAQIYKDIGTGNTSKVPRQLDDLSQSSSKAVRATALFTRADLALQQNDQKLAIATLKKIADDDRFPIPIATPPLSGRPRSNLISCSRSRSSRACSRSQRLEIPGSGPPAK